MAFNGGQNGAAVPAMDVAQRKNVAYSSGAQMDTGSESSSAHQGFTAQRLVLKCHQIFVNERQRSPVELSLEHRGVIYWALVNMDRERELLPSNTAKDTPAGKHDEDIFFDRLADFYHVWTLAEAFLLDSPLLPALPLLRWFKMYCQSNEDTSLREEVYEIESSMLEAFENGHSAEITADYWRVVQFLLIDVMPKRAAGVLRCHPQGQNNASEVGALACQLEKMPLLVPEQAVDLADDARGGEAAGTRADDTGSHEEGFLGTWTKWQRGCKAAAASFGVVAGASGGMGDGGLGCIWSAGWNHLGEGDRRPLLWLWGTLCGERHRLEEATMSWSSLFAAVLAFERPDLRRDQMVSVVMECVRKYQPRPHEDFLTEVIRDVSRGEVTAVVNFAVSEGTSLVLSLCAALLVDLLSRRREASDIAEEQRSWLFHRLVDCLMASPFRSWELAATFLGAARRGGVGPRKDAAGVGVGEGDGDTLRLLREMAVRIAPMSERATHELLEWCIVNGLGQETAAKVCRARGEVWMERSGLPAASQGSEGRGAGSESIPGASAKAAYWLAKGGGGVRLERLCADVSEKLMLVIDPRENCADARQDARSAALMEAEAVLAAIPPGITGPEIDFLASYKDIADCLMEEISARSRADTGQSSASVHAKTAGVLAVNLLAPCKEPGAGKASLSSPPSRTWAHLLRLAVPALGQRGKVSMRQGSGVGCGGGSEVAEIALHQVHVLIAKLQKLEASSHRVGDGARFGSASRRPYGFHGGREDLVEVRRALVKGLSGAMMLQNAADGRVAGSLGDGRATHRGRAVTQAPRLSAEGLLVPRVTVIPSSTETSSS